MFGIQPVQTRSQNGFIPFHLLPENQTNNTDNENPLPDQLVQNTNTTEPLFIPDDITRTIVTYISTLTPLQYHLERLSKHAPPYHPLLTIENKLLIKMGSGSEYYKPSKRICCKCNKYIGFLGKTITGVKAVCPNCSNLEENVTKRKNQLKSLRVHYLTYINPNGVEGEINPTTCCQLSYLLMGATKLGQKQNVKEVLVHGRD